MDWTQEEMKNAVDKLELRGDPLPHQALALQCHVTALREALEKIQLAYARVKIHRIATEALARTAH